MNKIRISTKRNYKRNQTNSGATVYNTEIQDLLESFNPEDRTIESEANKEID